MRKFKWLFVSLVMSFCGICSSADLYVNSLTGSDKYEGKSDLRPKKTIQAAVNASSLGDKIYVAPGVYAPFSVAHTETIEVGTHVASVIHNGASKVGDGQPWTPNVTVKGLLLCFLYFGFIRIVLFAVLF